MHFCQFIYKIVVHELWRTSINLMVLVLYNQFATSYTYLQDFKCLLKSWKLIKLVWKLKVKKKEKKYRKEINFKFQITMP